MKQEILDKRTIDLVLKYLEHYKDELWEIKFQIDFYEKCKVLLEENKTFTHLQVFHSKDFVKYSIFGVTKLVENI